ncbi:AAA family ATPase [Roseovarius sp. SK2]|uniref:AAA family ATPase n=2 Tax=Roseovarius TaxID=74030 RepID=UPI00237ACC8B|nr:AAA family ATPase [Roseovarius sp. SK2]MDD9725957.1 AAA family ATPase [Roseovarius sp. SK2]
MMEQYMNTPTNSASETSSEFAERLARSTVLCLFETEWLGFVSVDHAPDPDEFEDDDDPEFLANLPDDVTVPAAKRSWESPKAPLAQAMTEAEITACISNGCDPWAQSSLAEGRMQQKDDPPASIITAALGLSMLVDSNEHLHELFAPGSVTNFVCPKQFLWQMKQILERAEKRWKEHLRNPKGAELRHFVQDEDDKRGLRLSPLKQQMWGARLERSLSQGGAVLLVTTDGGQLDDAMNALVTRQVTWRGLSSDVVLETLRITHSATGLLSEAEIRRRLPGDRKLSMFQPAQIDAAFAAPTSLKVADGLAKIAGKLTRQVPTVTLDAVFGLGEVRKSLDRMLNDLNLWQHGDLPWSDVASSAVFHGPPGTGKTTLAKAFAGSAGIPIIATSYSDCQKYGHQGDMLGALDRAFVDAKQSSPAVLFIDELDSFSQRDARAQNVDYLRGVVNGLLEQINKTKDIGGLVLFGATNYLDTVDPAVIRSGRFDLKIHVPYPDKSGLEAILKAKIGSAIDEDVDTGAIADRLVGLSGADAEAVARDALGRARTDAVRVTQRHLEIAADQVAPELDNDTFRRAAVHEAGHVVVMLRLGLPLPKRVSLSSQGGQVEHVPVNSLTPATAQMRLQVLLAGRAAEICTFGDASSGAGAGEQSDLAKATSLALAIERHWGFGDSGLLWDGIEAADVWRAPAEVRDRVQAHLRRAQDMAFDLVDKNKGFLLRLAETLIQQREIHGEEVEAVAQECTNGTETGNSCNAETGYT